MFSPEKKSFSTRRPIRGAKPKVRDIAATLNYGAKLARVCMYHNSPAEISRMHLKKFVPRLAVFVCAAAASAAKADVMQVYYLDAGVQASTNSSYVENFNNATVTNGVLTTSFNGSGVTGTYTGAFQLSSANLYGGAGKSGNYIQPTYSTINAGAAYTLTLSQNVNYFGLWFSALDAGNQLAFYNGSTLIFSFGAQDFIGGVGSCPTSVYCGNPNYVSPLNDGTEQFAFINFYDFSGTFNKIVFSESPNSGAGNFESDNHTLANLASAPNGTLLSAVPEPGGWALLLSGLSGLPVLGRRRKQ